MATMLSEFYNFSKKTCQVSNTWQVFLFILRSNPQPFLSLHHINTALSQPLIDNYSLLTVQTQPGQVLSSFKQMAFLPKNLIR